jgi:hypothetical protein
MSVWEELRQAAQKLRSVPACPDPGACGGCVDSEDIANWLEHTADNMSDEAAYEETRTREDGSTYTVVVIDGHSHLGLSSEWTAALETARRINAVDVSAVAAGAAVEPVPQERVEKILAVLNGFVVHAYQGSVPYPVTVEASDNLGSAVAWAKSQPDIAAACGPLLGEANVQLTDGTLMEWVPSERRWAVTVSDDTEAVTE